MKKGKNILLGIIFLSFINWKQPEEFKKIFFYQNQVSIDVPKNWVYKAPYRRYSNYAIKYDAKISDEKSKSFLTVNVYDSSHMYNARLTIELLDDFKTTLRNSKGKSIKLIDSSVTKVGNNSMAFLKYTFKTYKGKTCYGAQLFFRTSSNNYYEIEIVSIGKSVDEFEPKANKIIKSLQFH